MPFTVREVDLPIYNNDKNHWNEVYQGLIAPAIKEAGLKCERDDEDVTSRLITENIWRKIEDADLILCDLSTFNPNVHLELGWALRADKRFVLIKDDITNFNFDLNQFYTYEYSQHLQPLAVFHSIRELSDVIKTTLSDNELRYSIVNKLSLQQQASKAASEGNIEVSLLKELLSEVRANRNIGLSGLRTTRRTNYSIPRIETTANLAQMLIGSTWRKKNDLEHIIFQDDSIFYSNHAGHPIWRENRFTLSKNIDEMTLLWSVDGLRVPCQFRNGFTEFIELTNPEECVWFLLSLEPHTPSWGI